MRMQAAVLYEQGKPRPYAASRPLVVEEVELEGPRAGEILVQVKAAGLCHSDLSTIDNSRPRALPAIPGHEGAGIVREVGRGVSGFAPGDHVVFVFAPSCGVCRQCRGGKPNVCSAFQASRGKGELFTGGTRLSVRGRPIGHYSGVSCFAEYAVVVPQSIVIIGKETPLAEAALVGCAVQTGVGAVINTAGIKPGDTVAVVGLGGVGLSCLLGNVLAGAGRIIAVDLSDDKLALARQLGATDTVSAADPQARQIIVEMTDGGVDVAFEMAGAIPSLELAAAITVRGGTTVTAGLPGAGKTLALNAYDFVQNEKRLLASYMGGCHAHRDIPRFIDLHRRGKLPVDRLLSARIPLADINAGFDRLADVATVRQVVAFD